MNTISGTDKRDNWRTYELQKNCQTIGNNKLKKSFKDRYKSKSACKNCKQCGSVCEDCAVQDAVKITKQEQLDRFLVLESITEVCIDPERVKDFYNQASISGGEDLITQKHRDKTVDLDLMNNPPQQQFQTDIKTQEIYKQKTTSKSYKPQSQYNGFSQNRNSKRVSFNQPKLSVPIQDRLFLSSVSVGSLSQEQQVTDTNKLQLPMKSKSMSCITKSERQQQKSMNNSQIKTDTIHHKSPQCNVSKISTKSNKNVPMKPQITNKLNKYKVYHYEAPKNFSTQHALQPTNETEKLKQPSKSTAKSKQSSNIKSKSEQSNKKTVSQVLKKVSQKISSGQKNSSLKKSKSNKNKGNASAFNNSQRLIPSSNTTQRHASPSNNNQKHNPSFNNKQRHAPSFNNKQRHAPSFKSSQLHATSFNNKQRHDPSFKSSQLHATSFNNKQRHAPSFKSSQLHAPSFNNKQRHDSPTTLCEPEKEQKQKMNSSALHFKTLSEQAMHPMQEDNYAFLQENWQFESKKQFGKSHNIKHNETVFFEEQPNIQTISINALEPSNSSLNIEQQPVSQFVQVHKLQKQTSKDPVTAITTVIESQSATPSSEPQFDQSYVKNSRAIDPAYHCHLKVMACPCAAGIGAPSNFICENYPVPDLGELAKGILDDEEVTKISKALDKELLKTARLMNQVYSDCNCSPLVEVIHCTKNCRLKKRDF